MELYMLYRQKVSQDISSLDGEFSQIQQEFKRIVRFWYAKALEEAKSTGHSIESITYEILEGVEDGFRDKQEMIEDGLSCSIDIIIDLLHHSALLDIQRHQKRVDHAQNALKEKIASEKANLIDTLETFKHYANDNRHIKFADSIKKIASKIEDYIDRLKG